MFCQGNLLGGLWLGGSDLDGRGDWTWIDGTVFWVARTSGRPPVNRYTNWETGEPRNAEIRQDCLLAANSGQWRDALCTLRNAFVCQAIVPANVNP